MALTAVAQNKGHVLDAIVRRVMQVASLWKIDDSATRDIMVDFYGRLLAGTSRSQSLREAQLAMLRDPRHAHSGQIPSSDKILGNAIMLPPVLRAVAVAVLLALTAPLVACDSVYYKTMRKFGVEKRDILVKRVRETRGSQEKAKEQFRTALEKFKSVVDVPDGRLEDKYETLNRELKRSEDRAQDLQNHIKDVKDVSRDLFKEWERELDRYSDRSLRRESERELRQTKQRAETMIAAMDRAQDRVQPVLRPLRDRVLFLKHNLNAQAIGALNNELVRVRGDVDSLIVDLEKSIAEADAFIKDMGSDTKSSDERGRAATRRS